MEVKSYKDLIVWKKSKELAIDIYSVSQSFPKEEIFGITNQLRRAAVSISNNIAEGSGRQYKKDTLQFLFISNGSLNEVENIIQIAHELGFINEIKTMEILDKAEEIRRLLKGFIKYFQDSKQLK